MPETLVTEYISVVAPAHGEALPAIAEGCAGNGAMLTDNVCAVPLPQEFEGVTEIVPADEPAVTVMLLLPCPPVMVQPEGTVHV